MLAQESKEERKKFNKGDNDFKMPAIFCGSQQTSGLTVAHNGQHKKL
jgi:hypothetical protein